MPNNGAWYLIQRFRVFVQTAMGLLETFIDRIKRGLNGILQLGQGDGRLGRI